MEKKWTAEEIKAKMAVDLKWLEHGVLAIYAKQTADEQQSHQTLHHNGIGFSGCDGRYLGYVARYLQSGHHLSGQHLDKTRNKMAKYSGQLAQIANAAQANQAA